MGWTSFIKVRETDVLREKAQSVNIKLTESNSESWDDACHVCESAEQWSVFLATLWALIYPLPAYSSAKVI